MSCNRSHSFYRFFFSEALFITLSAFLPFHPVYSQQPSISSSIGIFDHTADWGTDEFPPKLGRYKAPGKVELMDEDGLVYHLYGNGDDL